MEIRRDDLSSAATRQLLRLHLAGMHANSPPGHVFALDLSGLQGPASRSGAPGRAKQFADIGALKQLDVGSGGVKSMRTHPDHLRQGVGAAILEHIIREARARGFRRLSLETGRGPAFEPALALYRRRGFVDGGASGLCGQPVQPVPAPGARQLGHDPEQREAVFPRDKRIAFARRSCPNKELKRDDNSS